MLKQTSVFLALILFLAGFSAEAYTVILKKNGKVLNGTLVSEEETSIVFRDEQGVLYSLKKSALELEKMKEANAPPPAPAPAPAPEPDPEKPPVAVQETDASKKEVRVYTTADLENLREKYANIAPTLQQDFTNPTDSPESYYRALLEAVTSITDSVNALSELVQGMNTAWELEQSTGRDPAEKVRAFKNGKAYTDTMSRVSSILSSLSSLHSSMRTPPEGMKEGFDALSTALTALENYENAVKQYSPTTPIAPLVKQTNGYASTVDSAILQIQKVTPPAATSN